MDDEARFMGISVDRTTRVIIWHMVTTRTTIWHMVTLHTKYSAWEGTSQYVHKVVYLNIYYVSDYYVITVCKLYLVLLL